MQLALISLAVVLATANTAVNASNITTAVTLPVADLGINCQGSRLCDGNAFDTSSQLVEYINQASDGTWFNNGQHIACVNSICAFLQNSNGAPGSSVKALAHYIPDHNCKVCGSVPLFYPNDNNVANGELTFNAVSNPCTTGLC
ncbi:Kp4-domain-containing protein [Mycena vulgaris]|nr:Kp4-domain-containing protein [Mycena vulgaris]